MLAKFRANVLKFPYNVYFGTVIVSSKQYNYIKLVHVKFEQCSQLLFVEVIHCIDHYNYIVSYYYR